MHISPQTAFYTVMTEIKHFVSFDMSQPATGSGEFDNTQNKYVGQFM